ncbi:MAG: hypothetical protein DRP99_05930 [Candidatus Latescibacterota bacterium]|nr:MAG: hypothetical protein DRP99_05930 [Candidatus Latescibacterota bacterium]
MRLKDEVLKAIEEMEPEELGVLYEQIRLLKGKRSRRKKGKVPIEVVQDVLSTSKGSWSDVIVADREDRL